MSQDALAHNFLITRRVDRKIDGCFEDSLFCVKKQLRRKKGVFLAKGQ